MAKLAPVFKELPLEQLEQDKQRPRKDFGSIGDENRLFASIRDIGVLQPIAVNQVDTGCYRIIDGHRRTICAQRARLETVPCSVYEKLPVGEFERLRFELQENGRRSKPSERSEVLYRIRFAD
jgi:ParB/RepB/Spo0J family partition protein